MNILISYSDLLKNKIGKFIFAGLINTLFGYAIYAVLIYAQVPYLIALLISTILGVFFNYYSFGRIVFGGHRHWFVFIKFIISYALIYVVNGALLFCLTQKFLFSPYISQVACIPLGVFFSWFLMKYLVYK